MTDIPIIFSAPMVRALLDGKKTMTRRLAYDPKGRPSIWLKSKMMERRLWVRENVSQRPMPNILTGEPTNAIVAAYAADDEDVVEEYGFNLAPWWKSAGTLPCIHMPRWASRLTLVVMAAKIEKLQAINGLDALAEGITRVEGEAPWRTFKHLWESLHGTEGWDANPEVVALTFTVHKVNIDQMAKQAA